MPYMIAVSLEMSDEPKIIPPKINFVPLAYSTSS